MIRARRTIATLAAVTAGVLTVPAAAGAQPDDERQYVFDIVAVIEDIDGGTTDTVIGDEVVVTLDASVFFDTDEHDLRADAVTTLGEVADQIAASGTTDVSVGGHTDSRGSDAHNQALSERRANAVRDFLAARLPDVRLTAAGFGETQPVADNETPEGQQKNRRVEIGYTKDEQT